MALSVNTNISALAAQRYLAVNSRAAEKSTAKIASGLKITKAADDAAGLAISEKMRAQIRGLSMADKNVGQAIDLLNTADGGTSQMHEILQRMRELCVQAGNGTYTDEDREFIQMEINELKKELVRLYNCTEYNEKKVLKGGFVYQPSAPVLDSFDIAQPLPQNSPPYPTGVTTSVGGRDITFDLTNDGQNITVVARDAGGELDTRTVPLANSLPAQLWQTKMALYNEWSEFTSLAYYNVFDSDGYLVAANYNYNDYGVMRKSGLILGVFDEEGQISWADFNYSTSLGDDSNNLLDITYKAIPAVDGSGGFLAIGQLSEETAGLNVIRYNGEYQIVGSGKLADFAGTDIIALSDGSFITLGHYYNGPDDYNNFLRRYSMDADGKVTQIWERDLGYVGNNTMPTGSICQARVSGVDCIVAVDNTLKRITAVSIANGSTVGSWDFGGSYDFSVVCAADDGGFYVGGAGMAAKITLDPNNSTVDVDSLLSLPNNTITRIVAQAGQILLAGSDSSSGNQDAWLAGLLDEPAGLAFVFNMASAKGSLGVLGSDKAYDVVFNADGSFVALGGDYYDSTGSLDQNNSWLAKYEPLVWNAVPNPERVAMSLPDIPLGGGSTLRFDEVTAVFAGGAVTGTPDHIEIRATLIGEADPARYGARRLWVQTGANTGDGFFVRLPDMSLNQMGIETEPVVTPQERALEAIAYVDRAINYVSSERSMLGVTINRLEYTRDKNTMTAENTQAAESRIRDADMAREISALVKTNINVRAAQSVFAQSRQWPQRVLALLQ